MARKQQVKLSIDKLKVCLNQPRETYDYLHDYYSYKASATGARILEEDGFQLVFVEESEDAMTAALNLNDGDHLVRIGTFVFNGGKRYNGKAFFTFENSALYSTFIAFGQNEKHNYIAVLEPICDYLGLSFNNVTLVEVALDSNTNFITKLRSLIGDTEHYDMYLNGKKVSDDETLDGYGEYFSRSRRKLCRQPTLYLAQAKDTDMEMRVYDKAKELEESSPGKADRYHDWLGWTKTGRIFRVEVVLRNTNVREFCERRKEVIQEQGEHADVLGLLTIPVFRKAMFTDSADRIIYFRDKTTKRKVTIADIAGI